MNILFLTIIRITSINERGIYTDLLRKFRDQGHNVFIICPAERRYKEKTTIKKNDGITILSIRSLNIQKTNLFEKGIGTISLESLYLKKVKKYLPFLKVELVLYSTPPITFTRVVNYFKKKDNATSYLMLKDIFPQNAVDIEMLKKGSLLHQYFRKKEVKLYMISDYIGCMSLANVNYLLHHNSFLNSNVIEVCPNSIEPTVSFLDEDEKRKIKQKYNIPEDKVVCIYGGNLGKPQGVDFLLKILEANKNNESVFFVIAGNGTEFNKIAQWFIINKPHNASLLSELDKADYDSLLQSCDIGLLFLDPRFTIPNFPSRILSYMEYSIPVLTATDTNTDIGTIAEDEKFGFKSVSGDIEHFNRNLHLLVANKANRLVMGKNGRTFLENNYTVDNSYTIIMNHFHAVVQ